MSKPARCASGRTRRTSTRSLVVGPPALPDVARLVEAVPHLAPETLHRLIRYRGLDASADVLSAVTPAQMAPLVDLELWQPSEPAGDAQFDPARFAEWIETLIAADEAAAARVVAAMDPRLVVLGLSRFIRVFDPGALGPPVSEDDAEDDAGDAGGQAADLTADVGGYVVRARVVESWDAILTLLLALEAGYPDRFHATMSGCRRMSDSAPEADGLDALLTTPRQLLHDVSLEREARRSSQGHVTPADARAFLHAARQSQLNPVPVDPITAAYLSPFEPGPAAGTPTATPGADSNAPPLGADTREVITAVTDCLAYAGMVPGRPRALLAGGTDPPRQPSRLTTSMECVRAADESAYLARGRELAFLANCLMAGCSVQTRSFTVSEASDAAVATCELGLEHWPMRWPGARADGRAARIDPAPMPDTLLLRHGLIDAFRVGWAVLHETSLDAARRLIAAVEELHVDDLAIQRALYALTRELGAHCARGAPWHARDALDIIATFDVATWAALLGLLDECPILTAALPATVEGRTGAVSATAFEFVSTRAQLARIDTFLDRLPRLLVPL